VAWAHVDPAWRDMFDAVARFVPPPDFEAHPTAQVLRTGQSVLVPEVTDAWIQGAATTPEHRARALAAGFDMHFVKPIDPAELAAAVATLADRAG
jgi:DNA-binding response OmpR family regulator